MYDGGNRFLKLIRGTCRILEFELRLDYHTKTAMKKSLSIFLVLAFIPACSGNPEPISSPTPNTTATPSVLITEIPPTSITNTPTMSPTYTPTPIPGTPVTFSTTDDVKLVGTLFGEGATAIILAHQGSYAADQATWHPFARLLAERGYTALTFDFRGVGESGGRLGYGKLALDVNAAAQFLQNQGFQHIICIGASMGGTACMLAAQENTFDGLIILASTMTAGGGTDTLHISPEDLELLTPPKLFISASSDNPMVVNDTKQMYELSNEPKNLLFYPGTQHGTNLFYTPAGDELSAVMLRFLDIVSNQAFDLLPKLQPISLKNADKIQLLRTMEIPDYRKGKTSQCSVAFSPDGALLIGACGKNRVPIWNAKNGFLLRRLYDTPVQIVTCAFNPDGTQIACGGFDETVTRWYVTTGGKIDSFDRHSAPIWDLAFDPLGKSLVSCSLGLLGNGTGKGEVRLWNIPSGALAWEFPGTRDYLSLSFNPLGGTIAYGSIGGHVGILDVSTGGLTRELADSSANIGDVAYSPSGRWLAAGSDDNRIYLWDTSSYELASQFTGHAGYVNGVAFSPDETLLVSGSHDRTLGVWNLTDQKLITQLKGHEREVLRVAFSPDGTLIASISWDGTVRLWGIPQ